MTRRKRLSAVETKTKVVNNGRRRNSLRFTTQRHRNIWPRLTLSRSPDREWLCNLSSSRSRFPFAAALNATRSAELFRYRARLAGDADRIWTVGVARHTKCRYQRRQQNHHHDLRFHIDPPAAIAACSGRFYRRAAFSLLIASTFLTYRTPKADTYASKFIHLKTPERASVDNFLK